MTIYASFLLISAQHADCFDIVNEMAPGDALDKYYKAVVLAGEIHVDSNLWEKLQCFIGNGGTVLASADQLNAELLAEMGIDGSPLRKSIHTNAGVETVLVYRCHSPRGVSVSVSDSISGAPLVLEMKIGAGRLMVMLVSYEMTADSSGISIIFDELLQRIYNEVVGVQCTGQSCQMLVNQTDSETSVTLLNHTSRLWDGYIRVLRNGRPLMSMAWDAITGDVLSVEDMNFDVDSVTVRVHILPYGIKVISFGSEPPEYERTWPTVASSMTKESAEQLRQIIADGPEAHL